MTGGAMTPTRAKIERNAALRRAGDRDRLRRLAREGFNAARRIDAALGRGDPPPAWLRARLDEALAALSRARNRLVIEEGGGA